MARSGRTGVTAGNGPSTLPATSATSTPSAMPDSPADISVVICAYTEERWADLVAAVESIRQQRRAPREIIAVIDHNTALFRQAAAQFPDVRVIENHETRGLSGARNTGIAAAKGAIIAFMDEDAMAAPDWLEYLESHYAQPEVIGVGGAIEPVWLSGKPGWFPDEFSWVVGCTYRGMPTHPTAVRNLIGCNMSFRREVFAVAGAFRSGIGRVGKVPVGCEETELCIRATRHLPGAILLYEPAAKVFHRVPAARTRWRYFRSRCFGEGVSKALISRLVGRGRSLTSEWAYVTHTLPAGIAHSLANAVRHRDTGPALQAATIIGGLIATTAGYAIGSLRKSIAASPPAQAAAPQIACEP